MPYFYLFVCCRVSLCYSWRHVYLSSLIYFWISRSLSTCQITVQFNMFFLASAEQIVIKFSPLSIRRLFPFKKKVGEFLFIFRTKLERKLAKLIQEGHIVKLNRCTSEYFISPIVITAKKDGSVKWAMDAKPLNDQIHKNQYQMPNLLELLDSAAQIITSNKSGDVWLTLLDLKFAFSQNRLSDVISSQCIFNIVCGEQTGTYRFKTGFYGLTDMPKEFRIVMDNILQGLSGVFWFLDDILILSKGSVVDHNVLLVNEFVRLEDKGFAPKLSKCEFSLNHLSWFGFDIGPDG